MLLVLLQLEDYKCLFSMYFAMYYFFDKLADDTCIALDEYQLNPQTVRPARLAPSSPAERSCPTTEI
jgi:hypothetical protein